MVTDAETSIVHTGDCLDVLGEMPASSVHMCMTSPPYWQLRDYGDDTTATFGGEQDCSHTWTTASISQQGGQNTAGNPPDVGGNSHTQETRLRDGGVEYERCRDCGAYHGQLGLEPTADLYVQHIADVMDAVKRVLRPDGALWLNLGDTYDDKDLQQIPSRVSLECRRRGWTLRNKVTWAKPNPMPSSVTDRLNTTTEQIFHLTPEPDYWYDLDAIREPHAESTRERMGEGYRNTGDGDDKRNRSDSPGTNNRGGGMNEPGVGFDETLNQAGKNPGDVFEVTTKPFPDAHFAVYPPELCEKPIKASCPPKVCAECGAPYERHTRDVSGFTDGVCNACGKTKNKHSQGKKNTADGVIGVRTDSERETVACRNAITEGWSQTCDCATDATEPGICLDPFAGAGTTLLKAKELGRRFVGIELNPEYADMARARVGLSPEDPSNVRDDDAQTGLEAYDD